MKPAYHIPLSPAALRTMGEICAIQGQIEWLLRSNVTWLLGLDGEDVDAILGSTSIGTNVDIWARIIRSKCPDKRVLAHVDAVTKEIASLAAGRNDFIHAIFVKEHINVTKYPNGWEYHSTWIGVSPRRIRGPGRIVAMRTKNGKLTPISRLRGVRTVAAQISQRLWKIDRRLFAFELKANPPVDGPDELPEIVDDPDFQPPAEELERQRHASPRKSRQQRRSRHTKAEPRSGTERARPPQSLPA